MGDLDGIVCLLWRWCCVFARKEFRPGLLSSVILGPSRVDHVGSGYRSCLGAVGVGMINPVLEKAPDFDLANAVTPSGVSCTGKSFVTNLALVAAMAIAAIFVEHLSVSP
jgi:hypothetical protein